MNNEVMKAMNVFLRLSENDKKTFIDSINDYQNSYPWEQRSLNESIQKGLSRTGPLDSTTCPHCGK